MEEFFDDNEDTQEAVFTNPTGATKRLLVIFDRENSIEPVGNVAIQNASPLARCKTSDVTDIDNTCRLLINDVNYYIIKAEPDTAGMTSVYLSKDQTK